jgi:hypothetical protein
VTGAAGRVLDAGLDLLDRQMVDADGAPAGKVDDLTLEELSDGSLLVTEILSGPGALAPRLGGRLGAGWTALFRRLHPDPDPDPAAVPVRCRAADRRPRRAVDLPPPPGREPVRALGPRPPRGPHPRGRRCA